MIIIFTELIVPCLLKGKGHVSVPNVQSCLFIYLFYKQVKPGRLTSDKVAFLEHVKYLKTTFEKAAVLPSPLLLSSSLCLLRSAKMVPSSDDEDILQIVEKPVGQNGQVKSSDFI